MADAFNDRWGQPTLADWRAAEAETREQVQARRDAMNSPLALAKDNLRHAERMLCSLRPGSPMREFYVRKLAEYQAKVEALS